MTTMTMPQHLADAVAAELAPRGRVADLSARLDAALASQQYDAAAELQPALDEARADLAHAEALSRALREGSEAVEAQKAADAERIQKAQARDAATAAMNTASAEDSRAVRHIETSLGEMQIALVAAQRAYREALAWETKAGQARQAVADARALLHDLPPGHTAPRAAKPNQASMLVDQDPLIAALVAWRR